MKPSRGLAIPTTGVTYIPASMKAFAIIFSLSFTATAQSTALPQMHTTQYDVFNFAADCIPHSVMCT